MVDMCVWVWVYTGLVQVHKHIAGRLDMQSMRLFTCYAMTAMTSLCDAEKNPGQRLISIFDLTNCSYHNLDIACLRMVLVSCLMHLDSYFPWHSHQQGHTCFLSWPGTGSTAEHSIGDQGSCRCRAACLALRGGQQGWRLCLQYERQHGRSKLYKCGLVHAYLSKAACAPCLLLGEPLTAGVSISHPHCATLCCRAAAAG